VSGGYFEGLGVTAARGRLLLGSDDAPSAPPAVVVSHAFWQGRMGADPAAVGASIVVNGAPATVVGVAPAGFFGIEPGAAPDLWVPLSFYARQWSQGVDASLDDPRTWWLSVGGRLRPGATLEQAEAELAVAYDRPSRRSLERLPTRPCPGSARWRAGAASTRCAAASRPRCGSSWRWWASSSRSRARTWPASSSRGPPPADRRSRPA